PRPASFYTLSLHDALPISTPGIVIYFDDVVLSGLGKFSGGGEGLADLDEVGLDEESLRARTNLFVYYFDVFVESMTWPVFVVCRSEEHTSELQSRENLVCR